MLVHRSPSPMDLGPPPEQAHAASSDVPPSLPSHHSSVPDAATPAPQYVSVGAGSSFSRSLDPAAPNHIAEPQQQQPAPSQMIVGPHCGDSEPGPSMSPPVTSNVELPAAEYTWQPALPAEAEEFDSLPQMPPGLSLPEPEQAASPILLALSPSQTVAVPLASALEPAQTVAAPGQAPALAVTVLAEAQGARSTSRTPLRPEQQAATAEVHPDPDVAPDNTQLPPKPGAHSHLQVEQSHAAVQTQDDFEPQTSSALFQRFDTALSEQMMQAVKATGVGSTSSAATKSSRPLPDRQTAPKRAKLSKAKVKKPKPAQAPTAAPPKKWDEWFS